MSNFIYYMLALSSEKGDYFFSKLFLLIQASAFHPRGPFWQVGVIYVLWFWKKTQNFLLKHCFERGYPTSPAPPLTPTCCHGEQKNVDQLDQFKPRKMREMLFLFCGAASKDPFNWGEHRSAEICMTWQQINDALWVNIWLKSTLGRWLTSYPAQPSLSQDQICKW